MVDPFEMVMTLVLVAALAQTLPAARMLWVEVDPRKAEAGVPVAAGSRSDQVAEFLVVDRKRLLSQTV